MKRMLPQKRLRLSAGVLGPAPVKPTEPDKEGRAFRTAADAPKKPASKDPAAPA